VFSSLFGSIQLKDLSCSPFAVVHLLELREPMVVVFANDLSCAHINPGSSCLPLRHVLLIVRRGMAVAVA